MPARIHSSLLVSGRKTFAEIAGWSAILLIGAVIFGGVS